MAISQQLKRIVFCLALYVVILDTNLTGATTPSTLFYPFVSQLDKSSSSNQILIVSDFDGDNRSDLAVGNCTGDTYEIEIQLSAEHQKFSFDFGSYQLGVGVLASDVDRDNDQDLVFVSPASLCPFAIWLNNGRGQFERSNRWLWLNLINNDSPTDIDPRDFSSEPVFLTQDNLDLSVADFLGERQEPNGSILPKSQIPRLSFLSCHLTVRGPPNFSFGSNSTS